MYIYICYICCIYIYLLRLNIQKMYITYTRYPTQYPTNSDAQLLVPYTEEIQRSYQTSHHAETFMRWSFTSWHGHQINWFQLGYRLKQKNNVQQSFFVFQNNSSHWRQKWNKCSIQLPIFHFGKVWKQKKLPFLGIPHLDAMPKSIIFTSGRSGWTRGLPQSSNAAAIGLDSYGWLVEKLNHPKYCIP